MERGSEKILLIGDSSLLPRAELAYAKTYPVLLKRQLPQCDVEVTAVPSNTSYKILKKIEAYTLYGFGPKYVVLHYGIADVYPRPYSNRIGTFLECSGLQAPVDRFLKRIGLYYRLGDWCGFSAVSLESFSRHTMEIVGELRRRGAEKVIFVGIVKPDKILLRSRTVDAKVQAYNKVFEILERQNNDVEYVNMYAIEDPSFTIWDGYHYTEKASQYLAHALVRMLQC